MTALASTIRAGAQGPLAGPFRITPDDLGELNVLFSEAFTERYRRDGLVGVRVPPLNPAIWNYAIRGAGDGAMLFRDAEGRIGAFNFAHASGREGWMGPLAVREDQQGNGAGKMIVMAAIARLMHVGCTTIGLETMPRTVDNIGFYSRLGFVPGTMTVTLSLDAATDSSVPGLLSTLAARAREDTIAECAALTHRLAPGADYSNEMRHTLELGIGDVLVVRDQGAVTAFALCHSAPLVEGRGRDELRALKVVTSTEAGFAELLPPLTALARRSATPRLSIRMQGEFPKAFVAAVAAGARVRWTDLRMTHRQFPPVTVREGVVLSNWEI